MVNTIAFLIQVKTSIINRGFYFEIYPKGVFTGYTILLIFNT